ncbi:ABC transporter ATP-binding protein [Acetobacterium woodii]|nr:ABC transporter ATP-binding protein [Acetobacterium woodii]
MNLIVANGLEKKFQNKQVVHGLDLEIKQGEILALIGPNGVGKSTTIAMLLGIIQPDKGSVSYWRNDYKKHIGAQLQTTPFFEGYSARENLKLFGALYQVKLSDEEINHKLACYHLSDTGRTPAVKLSLGQQKRLAIGVTTVHEPELIILDEPTAGLDPRASHEIKKMILNMSENQRTVLFSSHNMDEVEEIADRVIFMNHGQIVAAGKPEDLTKKHQVKNLELLYLKLTETVK